MPTIEKKNIRGEDLDEIVELRSYTRKVFLGSNPNSKRFHFHAGHIHYKEPDNSFKEIDTTIRTKIGGGFEQDKASYNTIFPQFSDGTFEFKNLFNGSNHTLLVRPVTSHVEGQVFNTGKTGYIIYHNAFGDKIDLKVDAYRHGLRKLIVINEKPATLKNLEFEFEILNFDELDFEKPDKSKWDKTARLDFKSRIIKVGKNGHGSFFRHASVWDSNNRVIPVDIDLHRRGGKVFVRKTVTKEFLESAVFPVYTDHPTTYYTGAADGGIYYELFSATWDNLHDATSGTGVLDTLDSIYYGHVKWFNGPANSYIYRTFMPVDTSGITDTDTIDSATFNFWPYQKGDNDNDAQAYIAIVQTSAADPADLVVGDYDQCGDVNNPTKGSNDLDITNITLDQYNSFTLNATGLGWINKTGTTLLGFREGHDIEDVSTAHNSENSVYAYTSEATGTDNDPYLDVTTSAGATDLEINVNDSVTVSESVTLDVGSLSIDISDAVSISESLDVDVDLNPNVYEEVAVTDVLGGYSDLIFVTEFVNVTQVYNVNVNDSITVSESVSVDVEAGTGNDLSVNVNDSITVSENLSVIVHLAVNVNDSITVSENITVENTQLGDISVFDTLTIQENIIVSEENFVNVNDSVSVAENINLTQVYTMNVNDSIAIEESIDLENELTINVSETINLTETNTVENLVDPVDVSESITVSEDITITIEQEGVINVNVSDSITIQESLTVENTDLGGININDTVSIGEDITVRSDLNPNVNDNVTIEESVSLAKEITIEINDSVSLSELITVRSDLNLNINDSVTLSESVNMFEDMSITVNEVVVTDENVIVANTSLGSISVFEAITLTESSSVDIVGVDREINVSDSISITDVATVSKQILTILTLRLISKLNEELKIASKLNSEIKLSSKFGV